MDRRLRVRPQLDRARPAPDLVDDDVVELPSGELTRNTSVDGEDLLHVDVGSEAERVQLVGGRGLLLVRHRRRDDVDPVATQAADEEVADGAELDLAALLRLPVDLAAGGDRAVA